MRKGQYMALESVLSLAIGIVIAVGSITMFTDYRDEVLAAGGSQQAEMVKSEIASALYTLKEAESGEIEIDLPNQVGGESYTVSLNDNVRVSTQQGNYIANLQGIREGNTYTFSGSANGGSVKVFKNGNEFVLRDD